MKVLVTGAAGFVGSHIVQGLVEAGHDVVPLDRRSWSTPENRLQGERGDLNDPRFQKRLGRMKFDALVHCAALADISKNWGRGTGNRRQLYRDNVDATIALLEHVSCPTVFLSTGAVSDGGSSPYAATKIFGEAIVQSYCHARGVWWLNVRMPSLFGRRYHHGHVADIVEAVRRTGRFEALTSGRAERSAANVACAVSVVTDWLRDIGCCRTAISQGLWSWRNTVEIMHEHRKFDVSAPEDVESGWIGDVGTVLDDSRDYSNLPSIADGVRDALHDLGWYKR